MVTYEDQIKMLKTTKTNLEVAMRTAINATAMGWQSPDMEMVYNVVVKKLDQQIAEAEQKLAECNVVTTMSAGVSLLETIVANSKVGHITDIKV